MNTFLDILAILLFLVGVVLAPLWVQFIATGIIIAGFRALSIAKTTKTGK